MAIETCPENTANPDECYPWLEKQRRQWLQLRQASRLPHAVLIRGLAGSGKKALAKAMAADLLCEQHRENGPGQAGANDQESGRENDALAPACGVCSGCQMFAAGSHPDYHVIEPDGQFIKVAQIRQLTQNLSLSAHRGGHKVAIVHSAGQMNTASANALLKTLEEPTRDTCLILVSDESDRLLPTITSRCRLMPVMPPAAAELATWLGQDSERVQQALILAGGAPLHARQWLEGDALDRFMAFLDTLMGLARTHNSRADVLQVAQQWQDEISDQWLAALSRYLVHLQALGQGMCRELSGDRALLAQMGHLAAEADHWTQKLRQLAHLRQHQGSALKKELLLEEFLINWKTTPQAPWS